MGKDYYLSRMRAASEMARRSADPAVKLIHFDLAGRYSVAAATCSG